MPVSKQSSWSSSQDTFRNGSSEETFRGDLHDVSLDEGKNLPSIPSAERRPDALRNGICELLFVVVVAMSAASPAFLNFTIMVTVPQIGDALQLSPAALAWTVAAPACVASSSASMVTG
jgi:hypothetical protein